MADERQPVLRQAGGGLKRRILASRPARAVDRARFEAEPVTSPVGSAIGPASTVAGFGVGAAVSAAGKAIDQTISIATGNINPGQIIKYAITFVIFCCIAILFIQFARGIFITVEQIGCGIGHWGGGGEVCDPSIMGTAINSVYAMWDIEWIMRCLLYLGCAVVISMLLYVWGMWLWHNLLGMEKNIKKIDDWIFGFSWEDAAERAME